MIAWFGDAERQQPERSTGATRAAAAAAAPDAGQQPAPAPPLRQSFWLTWGCANCTNHPHRRHERCNRRRSPAVKDVLSAPPLPPSLPPPPSVALIWQCVVIHGVPEARSQAVKVRPGQQSSGWRATIRKQRQVALG